MLRKGELEPQGQVGVGCARGRAAVLGAARSRGSGPGAAPGGLVGFAGAHPRRGCCWSSAGFRGPLGDTGFAPWIKLPGLGIRLDEVISRPR